MSLTKTQTLPLTLGIDTARERLQLAVVLGDGAAVVLAQDLPRGHGERIMDGIGEVMGRAGLAYGDLKRIAVTTGPGSFTGLRIGLSVARALGLALDLPVIGVPSLLALSISGTGEQNLVFDAKRDQAYAQDFAAPGVPLGPPRLTRLDAALAQAGKSEPDAPLIDIASMTRFAQDADPGAFPPDPCYIRPADAKPQTRGKVARA